MGVVYVRSAIAATLVVVAVTLTACGGDEEPTVAATGTSGGSSMTPLERRGAVPGGWKVSATRHFSYAHPADWTVEVRPSKSGTPGEMVSEARGPAVTPGLPPDVVVAATPGYKSGLEGLLAINTADAEVRYRDRKVIKEGRPDVPGAIGARLIEGDVQNKGPDGTMTTVRQFDLVALSKAGTAVSLFVQVPGDQAESSRVRDIVETLEIR